MDETTVPYYPVHYPVNLNEQPFSTYSFIISQAFSKKKVFFIQTLQHFSS